MEKPKIKVMDEWKVKEAADVLKKAGDIFGDEDLFAAAEQLMQKDKAAIKSVGDIKKAYDMMCCEDMESPEEDSTEEDESDDEVEPMPTKMGMKKSAPTKVTEEDNLPPDSMFESYDQAKKDNNSKIAILRKKADALKD